MNAVPGSGEPFCPHYTRCGGCSLQHLTDAEHDAHKAELLPAALSARGVHPDAVHPGIRVHGARRRTGLALYRRGDRTVIGYKEARSLRIEPVERCPLLTPALQKAQAAVAEVFGPLIPDNVRLNLHLTDADNGIDALLTGRKPPTGGELTALLRRCGQMPGLIRLSIGAETTYALDAPRVDCSGTSVALPAGGFLQPSREGQRVLTEQVLQVLQRQVAPGGTVLDFFCGIGPYAIAAAAAGYKVRAYEADPAACAALHAAAGGRLSVQVRDLYRHPLCKTTDAAAAILNPPRQGAEAQMRALVADPVPVLMYVSCNPESFARDARIAVDAGYTLHTVQPVDQFAYTPQLECVGVFRRQE